MLEEIASNVVAGVAGGVVVAVVGWLGKQFWTGYKSKQPRLLITFDPTDPLHRRGWEDEPASRAMLVCFSVEIKNTSHGRLEHCRFVITAIDPIPEKLDVSANPMKTSLLLDDTFAIDPFNSHIKPFVQFDEFNGARLRDDDLGIELLCRSTLGYINLPIQENYLITVQASCESGRPVVARFSVGVRDMKFYIARVI